MVEPQLQGLFPNLRVTRYSVTSERSVSYNCIAWAADDDVRWWEPDPNGQYYWPQEVRREYNLETLVQVFTLLRYEPCLDAALEPGIEKIAIYTDQNGKPTHAARQLSTGMWTSKLGQLEDIEHALEGLEDSDYGRVAMILKRPEWHFSHMDSIRKFL